MGTKLLNKNTQTYRYPPRRLTYLWRPSEDWPICRSPRRLAYLQNLREDWPNCKSNKSQEIKSKVWSISTIQRVLLLQIWCF